MVAKIVPTYHPEGQSDTGEKDAVYEKLMREVAATKEQEM